MTLVGAKGQFADPEHSGRTWTVQEVARTRASMGRNPRAGYVTLEFTLGEERRLARDVPLDWQQKGDVLAAAFKDSQPMRDRFSFVHEGTAYRCEARPETASSAAASRKRVRSSSAAWYVGAGAGPEVRTVDSSTDDLASMTKRTDLKRRILAAMEGNA